MEGKVRGGLEVTVEVSAPFSARDRTGTRGIVILAESNLRLAWHLAPLSTSTAGPSSSSWLTRAVRSSSPATVPGRGRSVPGLTLHLDDLDAGAGGGRGAIKPLALLVSSFARDPPSPSGYRLLAGIRSPLQAVTGHLQGRAVLPRQADRQDGSGTRTGGWGRR